MTEHYYSQNPSVESRQQKWSYTLRGHSLMFTTDKGVFSKGEVDFGSKLLIESFQLPNMDGRLLDVGCGYGPIGLSLAKDFPSVHVDMVDVNERALALSTENARNNNLSNVTIFRSNALEGIKRTDYAAILTNPPIRAGKKVVHEIFEEAYNRLIEQGELWVVIQKKQGAPSAIEKLKSLTSDVEIIAKEKGYFIIRAKK